MTNGVSDLQTWLEDRLPPERAVIARLWGVPNEVHTSAQAMARMMLQPDRLRSLVAGLQPREREALQRLQAHGGTLPAPVIEREFGMVREAEQYANPRAYLLALSAPPSPIERLYVLGLAQIDQHNDARNFSIPADILALLPPAAAASATIDVQTTSAPAAEMLGDGYDFSLYVLDVLKLAYDGAIELIPSGGMSKASLLRLVRVRNPKAALKNISREEHLVYYQFLRRVGEGAELLRTTSDAKLQPTRAAIDWMRLSTLERARRLLDGWVNAQFDELASFRGIKVTRAYGRDLPRAKRALLRLLAQVPAHDWITIESFIAAVKAVEPDYARPRGVYDTWGIRSYSNAPLDGFAHWQDVEGQQIYWILAGSLYWLGLADVGIENDRAVSFRLTALGATLLQDAPPPDEPPSEPVVVQPNFEVVAPAYASLYDLFQLGRFAEPVSNDGVRVFKLSKRSLQAVLERGATYDEIERFLQTASGRPLPQNVQASLREWAGQHGRVGLRRVTLLETEDAVLMQQLQHDKRLHIPHTERLTDAAVVVREGDVAQLAERLRKAGYGLGGDETDLDLPLGERDLTVMVAALDFYYRACNILGTESDASVALRRRANKLLPEKALNRAFQTSHAALEVLRKQLAKEEETRRQGDKETREM